MWASAQSAKVPDEFLAKPEDNLGVLGFDFQVLTSQANYFSAELNLVQAQVNERLAMVQLYQAPRRGMAAIGGR